MAQSALERNPDILYTDTFGGPLSVRIPEIRFNFRFPL